jgi:hypothetical protein
MASRIWGISQAISSRLGLASLVFFAMLLLCSQAALAQFTADGKKLAGMLAVGAAEQGYSVALSADGATVIVGAPNDNSGTGAAWIFARNGEVWNQQGAKLVGSEGSLARQGASVALSSDGDVAIVGGPNDNSGAGAAWIFTRSGHVWTQQGRKLVGGSAVGKAQEGFSVALSADGGAAIIGGPDDNSGAGAAWIFTQAKGIWTQRSAKLVGSGAIGAARQGGSVAMVDVGNLALVGGSSDHSGAGAVWVFALVGDAWKQQGAKLVGAGAVGPAGQGSSVALSAGGLTAIEGGIGDNSGMGAAWVFVPEGGVFTQQGGKLVGAGAAGALVHQGSSVSLAADGDIAMLGASGDDSGAGAAWIFTRNTAPPLVWRQQGGKLVGAVAVGKAKQSLSVSLSGDGDTALIGGPADHANAGAAWVFVQPLQVYPDAGIVASGVQGGTFSPSSFSYQFRATSGSVKYSIANLPNWLTASSTSGTLTTTNATITFTINAAAKTLASGDYFGAVQINDTTGTQSFILRPYNLTVTPR